MLARTLLDQHYGDFERAADGHRRCAGGTSARAALRVRCRWMRPTCRAILQDGPIAAARDQPRARRLRRASAPCISASGTTAGRRSSTATGERSSISSTRSTRTIWCWNWRTGPPEDLEALRGVDPRIDLGIGVVDVKVNHIETADESRARIERAERALGAGRVRWVHPDCGFWMLKRSRGGPQDRRPGERPRPFPGYGEDFSRGTLQRGLIPIRRAEP